MATKQLNSTERKQANGVSRAYTTTKGEKVQVLKNGTKMVNGVEQGKVKTPEGTRMVMGKSGSSRLVKIGSGADAKYDEKGNYKKATYASPFKNTIQTTTGIRNRDIATQNKYNEVVTTRMTGTTPATATPTLGNNNGAPAAQGQNGQNTQGQPLPNMQNGSVTVSSYQDNGDGTTTNFLSDGTTSKVRYIKNADGSMTPVEVGSGQGSSPILDAEKEYTASVRQQLQDLNGEKQFFDTKIATLLKNNRAEYQDAIESIKSTFDSRAAQLGQSYQRLAAVHEKAGYQTDSFRYTPTHAEGLVTNDENNYIMQLADLDAQEQTLMLAATTAKNTKDWDALELQMKTYDDLSTKKSNLLGNLLTTATAQNTRIETEAKIQREIAEKSLSFKSGDDAIKRAASVAPVISKAIAKMTDEEAIKYVEQKALELGIDSDVLRSQVIDRYREDVAYAKSLIPKAEKPAKMTKDDWYGVINYSIDDPESSVDGVPMKDPSGYLTPQAFNALVQDSLSKGISRSDFIDNYGALLNPANEYAGYKLKTAEINKIKGLE